jgi:hypothetical protein
VVEFVSGQIGSVTIGRTKLNNTQYEVLHELGRSLELNGVPVPDTITDDRINRRMINKVVSLRTLSDNYYSSSPGGSDTSDKNRDTIRKRLQRTLKRLETLEIVGIWDGFVWEKGWNK